MTLKHTKDSLRLYEFLEQYANEWHSISKDKKTHKALERLQLLYGPYKIEFDGFTNQMRFNTEVI